MQRNRGFTIVELLIVIVVVAILAAISVVAYSGVQERAQRSAREASLSSITKKLDEYQAMNEAYPSSIDDCPSPSAGNMCLAGNSNSDIHYELLTSNSHGGAGGLLSPGYSLAILDKDNFVFHVSKEQSGHSNEFNRFIDIAPYIDRYGLGVYVLAFDLRSEDTSTTNQARVYLQNGSNMRYHFSVPVTTTEAYKRYTIEVDPAVSNLDIAQAHLSFFGSYGTGNIPVVKNVTLFKK